MREAAGLERAALAMLRLLGAGRASLVVPQPATASAQIGLGLNAPPAAEVELEPVLLRAAVSGEDLYALMTRGTAEKAINGATGNEAAAILEASMLRVGETQYRVVSVTVRRFGGGELLYELGIEE